MIRKKPLKNLKNFTRVVFLKQFGVEKNGQPCVQLSIYEMERDLHKRIL